MPGQPGSLPERGDLLTRDRDGLQHDGVFVVDVILHLLLEHPGGKRRAHFRLTRFRPNTGMNSLRRRLLVVSQRGGRGRLGGE